MRKSVILLFLILTAMTIYCQTSKSKIIGKYGDDISELTIKPDNTFQLKTPDYVFPYTYKLYYSRGIWTDSGNVLTLNPGKEKRKPNIYLVEKVFEGNDSVQIKINYLVEVYENEIMISKTPADFKLLTLYINKSKNYRHIVHSPIRSICAFSPRVKKQTIVDSSNIVRLPKQRIEQMKIFTYGFDKTVELIPTNPNANYFEITIIQPVDKDRTPRNKRVIIKRNYAYFYELNGKVPTSGNFLNGLKRID